MATISLVIVIALAFIGVSNACPSIITRAQWGARAANTANLSTNPPSHVVIHHSATQGCTTQTACANLVRSLQNIHMNVNGWADIGYNFLIGGDGRVYEGRGWDKTGAHAPGFNARSIGICFLGTFTSSLPIKAALNIARELIVCGVNTDRISGTYRLLGHRQASATECPGTALFNRIKTWPRWTANP